jgi:hypothetical protein
MKKQRRKKSITIEQAIKVIKIKFHEKNKKPSASIRRIYCVTSNKKMSL